MVEDAALKELNEYLDAGIKDVTELLSGLESVPKEQRSWNREALAQGKELQRQCLYYMGHADRKAETVEDQDKVILKFLKGMILSLWSTEAARVEDNLEELMLQSGMLEPFLGPQGAAGVPSKITAENTADTVSELARVCGAAAVGYMIYLSCVQEPGDTPPDQFATMLVVLALNSMRTPEQHAPLDAAMRESMGECAPTCRELCWLMHFIQAGIYEGQGTVHRDMKNWDQQRKSIEEQQKCCVHMIKAVPDCPRGYIQFAKAALMGQQVQPAALFMKKGLDEAKKLGADLDQAHLGYMLAACRMMGGLGDTWTLSEVEELRKEAAEQERLSEKWVPKRLQEIALLMEPWKTRTPEALMAQTEAKHGKKIASDKALEAVKAKVIMPQHTAQAPMGAFIRPDGMDTPAQ